MEIQQLKDIKYQKKEWTIRNYETLKADTRYCSEVFTISNCDWKFALYRGKRGKEDLAIYLSVADASNLPEGWSIHADFTLTVVNQSSREKSKTKVMKHTFCKQEVQWGHSSFMRLEELEEKRNGFIRDNKCIVEVEFYVVKPAGLVDFKDLDFANIKERFVPVLKEVFSLYPSLLDFKQNQIPQNKVKALNDLGQVLKFLKEKKWKHMKDEQSREELRVLWEGLETSGLDLRWLEPNVTSALNMKDYEKKAEEVTKLKQKLKALEIQRKELKEKLSGIEQYVEMTRKDLEKAAGFKKKDLDAKIGYPKP